MTGEHTEIVASLKVGDGQTALVVRQEGKLGLAIVPEHRVLNPRGFHFDLIPLPLAKRLVELGELADA